MKNRILKTLLFLVLLVSALLAVLTVSGDILVDKSLNRYYMLEKELEQKNENYDVQVYGSCHAYTSFNPMFLIEEYGISCYNLANPSEIMSATYLRMKERFSYDVPKVVLLDIWGLMAYETYIETPTIFGDYFLNNIERLPFSSEKIGVIRDFETLDLLESNFSAIRYRKRLLDGSLSSVDFQYSFEKSEEIYGGLTEWLHSEMRNRFVHNGYLEYPTIAQLKYSQLQNTVGSEQQLEVESDLLKYLDKISLLCKENGVKLIVYRAPYISTENELRKVNFICEYLRERQIPFYDLEKEIQFDYAKDFRDLYHLSYMGAEKATQFLAQDVLAEFGVDYQYVSIPVEETTDSLPEIKIGNDVLLLDEDVLSDGIYIDSGNGDCFSRNGENYLGSWAYIEIDPAESYYLSAFDVDYNITFSYDAVLGAYYDNNGSYISGLYFSAGNQQGCYTVNGRQRLVIPENAKYLRLCFSNVAMPMQVFLEIAHAPSDYSELIAKESGKQDIIKVLEEKTILNFGDGIFGNTQVNTSISDYIGIKTGALVYNCGFESGRMAMYGSEWDAVSMVAVAEYIGQSDFTALKDALEEGWSDMPGYFTNTLDLLENQIDFAYVDAITISYGTNDYLQNEAVLDNPDDPYDIATVCGALRYSIQLIQQKYPSMQILVTTPIFRVFLDEETGELLSTSNETDFGSGTLKDYAKAIQQACVEMNVPCLDLQNVSQINLNTRPYYFEEDEGIHPNAAGRRQMAALIGNALIDMLY